MLDYRPALRARTGVGEFVHELARALTGTDIGADEIVLFTSSWKDRPRSDVRTELPAAQVVDHYVPVRLLSAAWARVGWPPIETFTGACDIVHGQSPLLVAARRAAQVATVHDLDVLHHPERAEQAVPRDYPALMARHLRHAHHVVVSSYYGKIALQDAFNVPADRISVCSPGPPGWASNVAHARRATRSRAGVILFVGSLVPRKNVGGLLRAYRALLDTGTDVPPLVLVGSIPPSAAQWVGWVRNDAKLRSRVTFKGYVADAERPSLYEHARMLVLPSFDEGFGLPLLEAMACGVPVVVSDRGSLPEVAGDAADPVDPDDVDGLRQRMQHLLDDAAAGDAAERGLRQASRYSWQTCADAARGAYRAALLERGRR